MDATTQDFAVAVARPESRLRRLPDEAEIADDLRWTDSQAALIALWAGSRGDRARQDDLRGQPPEALQLG